MHTDGEKIKIHIAHSPDSDDAFMFYALAQGKLSAPGMVFQHILKDIETLNRMAVAGTYEVSAVSFHAYAHLSSRYVLLPCGASIGYGYGPIVVAPKGYLGQSISGKRVAIPGEWTTAFLALRLYEPEFTAVPVPFDRILDEVAGGSVDAGLIIHEGQITYGDWGLKRVVDLGEWWLQKTKLPLPLGGNVIRRDLGQELMSKVGYWIKQSILYGLNHREEALQYAATFARGLTSEQIDRFVHMYVNEYTVEYGQDAKNAVAKLLEEGYQKGVIPEKVVPEFLEIPDSI
jgi:1,4-dihydroxy-6-naphthoate synthase